MFLFCLAHLSALANPSTFYLRHTFFCTAASSVAMKDKEVVQIVRTVMDKYEIRQTQLAREVGLTQGRVSQMLTHKVRIADKIKINLVNWATNRRAGKRSGAVK